MTVRALTPSDHDDGTLARAHLQGDPEAFAALFRRYYPDLVRYVERRGCDHARAEDVAQETLARAYRYFGGFDANRPVWPWLRTIAVRIVAVEAGRRSNEVLVDDPATDHAAPGCDPLDAIARRSTLAQALRHLPLRQRDALVMRYIEDRQPSDIAAAFGLTRTAFEQLLWRARRSLAREYDKVCGALAPIALRLRRATAWVDARLSAFASSVLAVADVATGASIVAVATAVTLAASPSTAETLALASTDETVTGHGVAPRVATARPLPPPPPLGVRPGTSDTTVDASKSVGDTTLTTHTRVAANPTDDGSDPADHHDNVDNVPLIGRVEAHVLYHNGSGPDPVCWLVRVCVTSAAS